MVNCIETDLDFKQYAILTSFLAYHFVFHSHLHAIAPFTSLENGEFQIYK